MTRLVCYPSLSDPHEAADIITRLVWHFSPYRQFIADVVLATSLTLDAIGSLKAPAHLDQAAGPNHLHKVFGDQLVIQPVSGEEDWRKLLASATTVYVWRNPDGQSGPFHTLDELKQAAPNAKVVLADTKARASEASLLLSAGLEMAGNADALAAESAKRLHALAATITADTCHVLGTGPSLDHLGWFDLSGADVISCNSIVANAELMAALKPKIICAADPIFHAGPSAYAGDFRAKLRACMDDYDFHLVVPMRDYLIHLSHIDERHHHRVIGVPFARGALNVDLLETFSVSPVGNVMTLLMLPLAATLYKNITVSGADGRLAAANSYFWSHHKQSQFNDRMDDIKIAHPGFFNINYDDYYDKHSRTLEEMLSLCEKNGQRIEALTASYFPALRKRGAIEPIPSSNATDRDPSTTVLSINFDLVDQVGHYYNYEAKLGPAMQALGVDYHVAANRRFSKQKSSDPLTIDGIVFHPVFSVHSWSVGNAPRDAERFETARRLTVEQLTDAVERAAIAAPGDLIVYMYMGSLDHLEILHQATIGLPNVRVVTNLFWLKTSDVWSRDFGKIHGAVLSELENRPTLAATAMTTHQALALAERRNLKLPVACHPSPVFSDAKARELIAKHKAPRQAGAPVRIFMPAADRIEKGADLLAPIGIALRRLFGGSDALELIFRTDPLKHHSHSTSLASELGAYKLHEGYIEEDVLIDTLATADVVILPYLPPDFANRTSGLLVDALYAKTPVVVAGGTWLATFVERYESGVVVDPADPNEIALAAFRLVHSGEDPSALSSGARRYQQEHSWAALANQILEASRYDTNHRWHDGEFAAPMPSPLPVVSAAPSADAQIDYFTLSKHLAAPIAERIVIFQGTDTAQLTHKSEGFSGHLVMTDASTGLRNGAGEGVTVHDGRGALETAPVVNTILDEVKDKDGVIVLQSFEEAMAPSFWRATERLSPAMVVLGFQPRCFAAPGRAALQAAYEFTRLGMPVAVVERRPLPGRIDERAPIRRVALGLHRPSSPDLPCDVVAWRADLDVMAIKAAFGVATSNAEYVEAVTDEMRAAALLAEAPAIDETLILKFAPTKDDGWQIHGLNAGAVTPERLTPLQEVADLKRVHRVALPFRAQSQKPITISVEVEADRTQFITLWLTDLNNKIFVEATYDLVSNKSVGLKTSNGQSSETVTQGIAPSADAGQDIGKQCRIWLTVDQWDNDAEYQAQVVIRESAFGSVHYVGTPERSVRLRNMLVEARERPSRLPSTEGFSAARPLPGPTDTIDLLAGGLSDDPRAGWWLADKSSAVQATPNGLSFERCDASYGDHLVTIASVVAGGSYDARFDFEVVDPQVHVIADDKSLATVHEAGVFHCTFVADSTELKIAVRAANRQDARFVMASATLTRRTESQDVRPASIQQPVDLIVRGIANDIRDGWAAPASASISVENSGLVFNRNNSDYADQLSTLVTVEPLKRYRLELEFTDVSPEVHVFVGGQLVRVKGPGPVMVPFVPRNAEALVHLRGANSDTAGFTVSRALINLE
ncbi:MAG: glycosyltransferase [Pseudomonadota bacterium]